MAELAITARQVDSIRDAVSDLYNLAHDSRKQPVSIDAAREGVKNLLELLQRFKPQLDAWMTSSGDYPSGRVAAIRDLVSVDYFRSLHSEDVRRCVTDELERFRDGPLWAMWRELSDKDLPNPLADLSPVWINTTELARILKLDSSGLRKKLVGSSVGREDRGGSAGYAWSSEDLLKYGVDGWGVPAQERLEDYIRKARLSG